MKYQADSGSDESVEVMPVDSRTDDRTMLGKWLFAAAVAVAVIALDQWTKLLVVARMDLHESIPLIDGLLSLTYVRNTGAAFGILAGRLGEALRVPFFLAVSGAAVAALVWFVRGVPARRRWILAACGGVLGGAVGNMIDRIRLGSVIDFVDVYVGTYHWPTFNVADSAITVGVILLCVDAIAGRDGPSEPAPE
jgi:signal peptidase II